MLDQLADDVGGAIRIAHRISPGAAQLGVDIAVARHAVYLDRTNEFVDALAAIGIVGSLGLPRNKARVIDKKIHVREELGDDPDIGRKAVLVGALTEGKALVDADILYAKGAGLLDHAQARV